MLGTDWHVNSFEALKKQKLTNVLILQYVVFVFVCCMWIIIIHGKPKEKLDEV